jgi:hypothetical protein
MNLRIIVVLATAVALPAAASAEEHECACCPKKHASHEAHGTAATPTVTSGSAPTYDVRFEGVFSGIVVSVMRHQGMDVQLTVGVGEATFEVLVAPIEWLDRQSVAFRIGERLEIVGTQDPAMPNMIIAREIRTPGQTVVLRDNEGKALWN